MAEWPVIVWSLDNNQLTEVARIPAQDIQVAALALNSDGSLLGMIDSSGTVHLISLPDGKEVSVIDTSFPAFRGARLTFSADDRRLLAHIMDVAANSVPLDGIYLWDVSNGAQRLVLRDQPRQWIDAMQFSPDGHWLAVSYFMDRNSVIELWDVKTSLETGTGTPHTMLAVESSVIPDLLIAFSEDTKYLAMVGYDNIFMWDIDAQTQQTTIENVRQVQALAFSPDGSLLATTIDVDQHPSIGLWDTRTGAQWLILAGYKAQITALAFNPDGTLLASGSLDGTVRLWGIPLAQQQPTTEGVNRIPYYEPPYKSEER